VQFIDKIMLGLVHGLNLLQKVFRVSIARPCNTSHGQVASTDVLNAGPARLFIAAPCLSSCGTLTPFPFTPEQNGLRERSIRTLSVECAWQQHFKNLTAARATIARYLEHHNTQRRHSALKYNTSHQAYLNLCNSPQQQAA
jgi:hypothetical protein